MKPTEIIRANFQLLMDEYGYSIAREVYSSEIMGNAELVLISQTTGIKVVVDRSQVFVNIGDLSRSEDEWMELSDVVHFYAPTLVDVYSFPTNPQNNQDSIESQVERLVRILRQYCEPVLKGDFSNEDQIKEIEGKRVEEMLEYFKRLSEDRNRSRE